MTGPSSSHGSTLYLWPLRTLYVGDMAALPPISTGAHTMLLGLDHDARLTVSEQVFSGRAFMVPAGTVFQGDPQGGRIACCFLDPLGRDFAWHSDAMQKHGEIWSGSQREAGQLDALKTILDQQLDAASAYAMLEGLLFPSSSERVEGHNVDERIATVVQLIRSDPAENISNDQLGAEVALSGTRLQRLFKDTTGVPIRRYRLWHRLFVTASMMAMGSTLTDAALAAGFSDSSHLNHVFKSMLGMKPSLVLRSSRKMRILVGSDQ